MHHLSTGAGFRNHSPYHLRPPSCCKNGLTSTRASFMRRTRANLSGYRLEGGPPRRNPKIPHAKHALLGLKLEFDGLNELPRLKTPRYQDVALYSQSGRDAYANFDKTIRQMLKQLRFFAKRPFGLQVCYRVTAATCFFSGLFLWNGDVI